MGKLVRRREKGKIMGESSKNVRLSMIITGGKIQFSRGKKTETVCWES